MDRTVTSGEYWEAARTRHGAACECRPKCGLEVKVDNEEPVTIDDWNTDCQEVACPSCGSERWSGGDMVAENEDGREFDLGYAGFYCLDCEIEYYAGIDITITPKGDIRKRKLD